MERKDVGKLSQQQKGFARLYWTEQRGRSPRKEERLISYYQLSPGCWRGSETSSENVRRSLTRRHTCGFNWLVQDAHPEEEATTEREATTQDAGSAPSNGGPAEHLDPCLRAGEGLPTFADNGPGRGSMGDGVRGGTLGAPGRRGEP